MVAPDPLDEVAALITRDWSAPGRVTAGFRLDEVRSRGDGLEIAFHWRRDPQPYLLRRTRVALASGVGGVTEGDAPASADEMEWALRMHLMEELDTGFVGRARRMRVGDEVLLEERPLRRSGWFVGRVPLMQDPAAAARARRTAAETGATRVVVASGPATEQIPDPGGFLLLSGLDPAAGRAAAADGSLIAWLQIDRGLGGSPRAGQAVVVRSASEEARIALLTVLPGHPGALEVLAATACRVAIEAGAARIEAAADLTGLRALGFRERDGRLLARHDEVVEPVPVDEEQEGLEQDGGGPGRAVGPRG